MTTLVEMLDEYTRKQACTPKPSTAPELCWMAKHEADALSWKAAIMSFASHSCKGSQPPPRLSRLPAPWVRPISKGGQLYWLGQISQDLDDDLPSSMLCQQFRICLVALSARSCCLLWLNLPSSRLPGPKHYQARPSVSPARPSGRLFAPYLRAARHSSCGDSLVRRPGNEA